MGAKPPRKDQMSLENTIDQLCRSVKAKLEHVRTKSSSGLITITINPFAENNDVFEEHHAKFHIEFGGCDIEGMARREDVGCCTDLEKGLNYLIDLLEHRDVIV